MEPLERRIFKRVPCEINAYYRDMQATEIPFSETVIGDISEGGARFFSKFFIPMGCRLHITMNLTVTSIVEAVAEPVWVKEIPGQKKFDVGTRFVILTEYDRSVLHDFLGLGQDG